MRHRSIFRADVLQADRDVTANSAASMPTTQPQRFVGSRIDPSSPLLHSHLQACIGALPFETLQVLFLDRNYVLIAQEHVQQGSTHNLLLNPNMIFRRALALDASAMILAHNHPSGDPRPSTDDIRSTEALVKLGQMLAIEIIEHVIVVQQSCFAILHSRKQRKAKRLAAFFDLAEGGALCQGNISPAAAANARTAAIRRTERRQLLGHPSLLANPAWDMLIDLFVHTHASKPVFTSALCVGSGLPMSNALRLIRKLRNSNVVYREPDPSDGRRYFIRLTPHTMEALNRYFCKGPD
ncbi:MAG: hypothetical protein KYX66_21125 [Blastomonas fulva]|uniref:JAB domain-containing protein n=1 Tax=Blastomonas fulva TaxID=1550728 RepID=UPI0024E268EE|nr:JAB domain-containing protein [Blastomonas fulva]MDK2759232.1 hypothetical protein [Blastomonas fulva]